MSELEVSSDPEDTQSMKSLNLSTTSLLDQFVGQVRESLGVESHLSASRFVLFRTIKNRWIHRKANNRVAKMYVKESNMSKIDAIFAFIFPSNEPMFTMFLK